MSIELNTLSPKKWVCNKCNMEKEEGCFRIDKRNKSGREGYCRECSKKWYRDNADRVKIYVRRWQKDNPIKHKYTRYKVDAKRRDYEFSITIEQFAAIITQPCHYCGESISEGVDRKNNNIGYIFNNCLPCCSNCNRAKSEMSYEDFGNFISKVFKHMSRIGDNK